MAVNRIRGAFAVPRKGETFELRAGLVSQYAYERKESIQKTIMAMTLGKDVSALFPDVLKNIATADLDQKKLVYLYLMYVNLSGCLVLEGMAASPDISIRCKDKDNDKDTVTNPAD